ncbi:hypothetical protein BJY01DRAFT_251712 [Aspergillus pseudoustus]|uniref:Uncharacterized protein n=1 Tax=Aspergillus pseudoustus TaxID=1810923 RepID=A0ABR4JA34_9EURO
MRSSTSLSNATVSDSNTEVSSVQSSVCASVTTNPTTVTPSAVTSSALVLDPYRDSFVIPKIRAGAVSVYPYGGSLISDSHYERFRVIVDIFKENVESDTKLKLQVAEIGYELRLCGRSPKEAQPSILVYCTERIFNDLKGLLASSHLKAQYAILARRRFRFGKENPFGHRAGADVPRFSLYFWRGQPHRLLSWRGNLAEDIQIKQSEEADSSDLPWSNLTMCGSSLIGLDGSCSTLACLVEVDSAVYGLTVAHSFAHLPLHPWAGDGTHGVDHRKNASEELMYLEDDVEYESVEEADGAVFTPAPSSTTGKNEPVPGPFPPEQPATILVMQCDHPDTPDLDWALFEVSPEQADKPNFYLSLANSQKPTLLHKAAQRHPGHEREVIIIRSLHDHGLGTLLRGSSFIGGINRSGQCEVWNVALTDAHGLIKGDSGSLVVDHLTNEIYGYVVALNPMGEAYIMPLAPTLTQIKEALGADNASLPDPHLLVSKMINNHTIGSESSVVMSILRQALDESLSTSPSTEVKPTTGGCATTAKRLIPHMTPADDAQPNLPRSQVNQKPQVRTSSSRIPLLSPQRGTLVFEERNPDEWKPCSWDWEASKHKSANNVAIFVLDRSKIKNLRNYFDHRFWSILDKGTSSSFHCEYDDTYGPVTPKVSWACFRIQNPFSMQGYGWRQACIHVEWDLETQRQLIFIFYISPMMPITAFQSAQAFLDRTSDFEERQWNPFAWHERFVSEVLEQYESSSMRLKDYVEGKNMDDIVSRRDKGEFPTVAHYAPHLLHSFEAIEVAEHTIKTIFKEQDLWHQEKSKILHENNVSWLRMRSRLLLEANRAHSLKVMMGSLRDRYIQEVNLASKVAVKDMAYTALKDSDKLKALAILTLVYLPGTYTSALFSTPFFSVGSDGLSVSNLFWSYWATAIPLTVVTMIIWFIWAHPLRPLKMLNLRFGRARKTEPELPILPA